jgi:branched-chain amino acid transport system permease protein
MQFASSPRNQTIAILGILILGAALIAMTRDGYTLFVLTLVPIWAVMGLSWNLLGGYLGLVSFGQAAFFGLGAFTVVILAHDYGITPWIGLPLAGLVGAVSGVLIGVITFRFRGFYFALAMLAYPLALLNIFEFAGWNEVTIPMHREQAWKFMQFADARILAWLALAAFGLAISISLWVERSRFGLFLFAIRQDETAARTSGIPALRNKLKAIAISGAMAGIAGGIYALLLLVVTPVAVFGMLVSAQALIVAMFGGRGTAWGAAIGAAMLIPVSELLHGHFGATLPGIAGVVFGMAIILVVLLLPNGIYWAFAELYQRRFVKHRDKATTSAVTTAGEAADPLATSIAMNAAKEICLKVTDVSVAFGGVQALQNVSFDIHRNEILGIIGPNGAGKTTLFNVLSGLTAPQTGSAVLDGMQALIGRMPEDICAMGVGRTFQTVRVFNRLTLLENVATGAFVKAATDKAALGKASNALEQVGMKDRAMVMGGELNNRELRLMELARALAGEPKIILLDECLAGLSSDDIDHLIVVLRKVRNDGVTLAIIEHTMDAMRKLADRMVVMNYGTVLVSGPPVEVLRNPEVISAYLGKRWAQHAQN